MTSSSLTTNLYVVVFLIINIIITIIFATTSALSTIPDNLELVSKKNVTLGGNRKRQTIGVNGQEVELSCLRILSVVVSYTSVLLESFDNYIRMQIIYVLKVTVRYQSYITDAVRCLLFHMEIGTIDCDPLSCIEDIRINNVDDRFSTCLSLVTCLLIMHIFHF